MRPSLALQTHRHAIHEIVQRHHAGNPRLFGSTARGQDHETSDIDLLIDPAPGMTLFDIGGLIDELEKLLGVRVDVVTPAGLPPHIRDAVQQDLQSL
jgi:predicted nucleotidyltransferase